MTAAVINWDLKTQENEGGATGSALGITEIQQIVNRPGKLWTILCVTSGSLTLLDGTGGSGAALLPSVAMTAGQTVLLGGFPFFKGLYVSDVSGAFNLSFS